MNNMILFIYSFLFVIGIVVLFLEIWVYANWNTHYYKMWNIPVRLSSATQTSNSYLQFKEILSNSNVLASNLWVSLFDEDELNCEIYIHADTFILYGVTYRFGFIDYWRARMFVKKVYNDCVKNGRILNHLDIN